MNEDKIVQFICFVTQLEYDDFISNWEPFSKGTLNKVEPILLEAASQNGQKKYRYVSQHECKASALTFFKQGRSHDFLPEHVARIVSAGGYTLTSIKKTGIRNQDNVKVMAFLSQDESNLDYYKGQDYQLLNVFAAYFESCQFSNILVFFLSEEEALDLVDRLNKRNGVEACIYRECPIFHA